MAIFAPPAHSASTTGYTIDNSLRFNSGSSQYLSRTFGTPTDNKKWTWSGWVKRSALNSGQAIFGASNTASTLYLDFFKFGNVSSTGDWIQANWRAGTYSVNSTPIFRDPSGWYHIVISCDYTKANGTGGRCNIYANGVNVLSTDVVPQNYADSVINASGYPHYHGVRNYNTALNNYLSGYLSDIYFIDGQALSPTDFGETNADGVWVPIAYTGGVGANGFHLDFADGTSTTGSNAASLGYDSSGSGVLNLTCTTNGTTSLTAISGTVQPSIGQKVTGASFAANTYVTAVGGSSGAWTATLNNAATTSASGQSVTFTGNSWKLNGLERTAGVSECWMTDTPTNNFATLNPIDGSGGGGTFSNGALTVDPVYSTSGVPRGSIWVSSGKWYWEVTVSGTSGLMIGYNTTASLRSYYPGYTGDDSGSYFQNGQKYIAGSGSTYGASYTTNDVISVALDMDSGAIYFAKNGQWADGAGNCDELWASAVALKTGITGTVTAAFGDGSNNGTTASVNFGQGNVASAVYDSASGGYFKYTPPTGFKALSTANLP